MSKADRVAEIREWRRTAKSARTGKIVRARLFVVWVAMRQRCNNPNNIRFPRYGGRGITINSRWDDYAVFRAWSIANGYRKGFSIDRINRDGDYSPTNCQWIPHTENCSKDNIGSKHGRAKITEQDAKQIKALRGRLPQSAIAARYGLERTTVGQIQRGIRWSHLK